jgi:indolepyruvate ferredoxin oxidoreductase beta subunit
MLTMGLLRKGYDVKMSEIHGMSQRGGSVSAQIRYGREVYSPVIGEGEADILISFEEMETYRWLRYVNSKGKVIMNCYRLPSAPILSGEMDYPEGLVEEIEGKVNTIKVDAMGIVQQLGSPKSMNMALLGTLIAATKLDDIDWEGIMKELVAENFVKSNMKALRLGMACS